MTSQDGEAFLTLEEAAALLGVSSRTILRYVEEKKLKRYKRRGSGIRTRFYYKRSEILQFNEMVPEDNDQQ